MRPNAGGFRADSTKTVFQDPQYCLSLLKAVLRALQRAGRHRSNAAPALTKLLLQCREDRDIPRIGWLLLVTAAVSWLRSRTGVGRPLQLEIVLALQTCHIHDGPAGLSFGKKFRQRGHIHPVALSSPLPNFAF